MHVAIRFFVQIFLAIMIALPASTAYAADLDGDGYDGASAFTWDRDCNDADAAVYPDSPELCDGKDNDCDGRTDFTTNGMIAGGVSGSYDRDGDGRTEATVWWACPMTAAAAALVPTSPWNLLDCNDADAAVRPGATEVCDGKDNDCDNLTDAADRWVDAGQTRSRSLGGATGWQDGDGDGYGSSLELTVCPNVTLRLASRSGDCNDRLSSVRPGAPEVCDRRDNDCDRLIDAADSDWRRNTSDATYRLDADTDGYWGTTTIRWCSATPLPQGAVWSDRVGGRDDCNDSSAAINPRAVDFCDGVDNDCDQLIDDADTDQRWMATANLYLTSITDSDQDDAFAGTFTWRCAAPSGAEGVTWASPDLWDCNDADAALTSTCPPPDHDRDGYSEDEDCDDDNALVYPGAAEVNDDFLDSDCDGSSTWYGGQWTAFNGVTPITWAQGDVLKSATIVATEWSLNGANPPRPTSGSAPYPGPELTAGISHPWVLIPPLSGGRRLQVNLDVPVSVERAGGAVVITVSNPAARTALLNAALDGNILDIAPFVPGAALALAAGGRATFVVPLEPGSHLFQLWDTGGSTGVVRLVGAGVAGTL